MISEKKQWYCEWASSLGALEDTAENVWGTLPYDETKHINESVVFFGLYGFPSFFKLWRHKGRKAILWCGSDIRHFNNGYWLDDKGGIRLESKSLAQWISKNCESWVENQVEYDLLKKWGIESQICPSFLGDVGKFTPQITNPERRYYSSISGDDFELYRWPEIMEMALKNPEIEYHLYGNTKPFIHTDNMIMHGRVPKETMNEETKSMTGTIRLLPFEGCSELIVKSVLWGQKPISSIDYPFLEAENPREELLKIINRYPWNMYKNKGII